MAYSRRCASVYRFSRHARGSRLRVDPPRTKSSSSAKQFSHLTRFDGASDGSLHRGGPFGKGIRKTAGRTDPGIVAITIRSSGGLYSNFVIVCKSGKLEIIQFSCTEVSAGLRFHNYVNGIDKAAPPLLPRCSKQFIRSFRNCGDRTSPPRNYNVIRLT